jgi:hypothetical protein
VAGLDEVVMVGYVARQRERVAVVDQRKPFAVPAPVPVVPILLGDEGVEERCGETSHWVRGRRGVAWPTACL